MTKRLKRLFPQENKFLYNTKAILFLHYFFLLLQVLAGVNLMDIQVPFEVILYFVMPVNRQLRLIFFRRNQVTLTLSFIFDMFIISSWSNFDQMYLPTLLAAHCFDIAMQTESLDWCVGNSLLLIGWLFVKLQNAGPLLILLYTITALVIFLILKYYVSLSNNQDQRLLRLEDAYNEIQQNIDLQVRTQENRDNLAVLRERNRISREVHDSVGHSLSTIILQLTALERVVGQKPELAREMLSTLSNFSRNSLEKIRGVLHQMKPQTYSAYEIILRLDDLAKETSKLSQRDVSFRHSGDVQPTPEEIGNHLIALSQEAFTNALRHGKATRISAHLHFGKTNIVYNIEDNGRGTDIDAIKEGIGLRSISERIRESGGKFSYRTGLGRGFHIRIALPLNEET